MQRQEQPNTWALTIGSQGTKELSSDKERSWIKKQKNRSPWLLQITEIMEEDKIQIEYPTKVVKATKNVSKTEEMVGNKVNQTGNLSQNVDTVIW